MKQLELALSTKSSRVKEIPMDRATREKLVRSMAMMIAAVARANRRAEDDASEERGT